MDDSKPAPQRVDYVIAMLLAVAALAVYCATLTPSLSRLSPDGAELATVPYYLGLTHSPGYPLYTWIGKLFTFLPFGDVAHRLNLMSGAMAALSVGGVYLIAITILPIRLASWVSRRAASSLAALLLAFSPTLWSQAVIAEVYAPNLAMITLTLLALLRWERTRRDFDFFLFSLTFGLSLGTHLSDLGFALGFAVFILLTNRSGLRRPKWWLAGLGGFILGAAQFAWVPLRASTLNDRLMLARAPTTLSGLYKYTLGAFPQIKFAFPWQALPDRLVIYLDLLRQQFGLLGIVVGVVGLASLLLRRPRHYFLLVGMYMVQVWFFIQYNAFDLEVFFLPAHFLWALFLAIGAAETLSGLAALLRLTTGGRAKIATQWGLASCALSLALFPLLGNFAANDRSDDVALNDFYASVWETLPQDAVLLTQGGVFGFDAFYWRLVYDTRPDVLLPAMENPNLAPCDHMSGVLYSTTPMQGAGKARGPGALAQCPMPEEVWQVPVLIGPQSEGGFVRRGPLVLFRLSQQPPELTLSHADPSTRVAANLGGLVLVGVDLESQRVESGDRLHLVYYWRMNRPNRYQVQTYLGELQLESHELGFGNLARYHAEVQPITGQVIVEDYWLVIPSTAEAGEHVLEVGLSNGVERIVIGSITVVDNQEAMERWLKVAGRSSLAP
ncbi:MAG: DUF2723 domain-containing protein [Anaerolineales bacterium]|jgi:hypothetical protein